MSSYVRISVRRQWVLAALIGLVLAVMYLALRPPLYDIDGFPDRLDALGPDAISNLQPNHLLWIPFQITLVKLSSWIGYPNTVPFQVVGILINSSVLFFLFLLLYDLGRSWLFSMLAVIFVAFSPWFWYLGFENRPYPIVFLSLVLFFSAWNTSSGDPPSGWRLTASGACVVLAILMHQAIAVMVPAAMLVLWFRAPAGEGNRALRVVVWGGSIALIVGALYFAAWRVLIDDRTFLQWASGYLGEIHPIEASAMSLFSLFARSIIGILATLVQSAPIQKALSGLPLKTILDVYGTAGVIAVAALSIVALRSTLVIEAIRLLRANALFALSLLCALFWCAFVLVWEPSTPNYWSVVLFPMLVCAGLLVRQAKVEFLKAPVVALVVIVSAWNIYFNYQNDRELARNFPEPNLAAIEQHVGAHDLFIVLAKRGWLGDMDYELLFMCLDHTEAKNRGVAILEDLVYPSKGSASWQRELSERISSTLTAGNHVYVAHHVLDPDSYADICGTDDPTTPYVDPLCAAADTRDLRQQVEQILAPYDLRDSDFHVGGDYYYLLVQKT